MEIRSRTFGSWTADFSQATPPRLRCVQERSTPVIAPPEAELPVGTLTIAVESIGEGTPYQIVYHDPTRRIPGSRNALRIEEHTPFPHCELKPLTKRAMTLLKWDLYVWRPEYFDDFGYCSGTECRTCSVPPQFSLDLFAHEVDTPLNE